MEGPAELHHFFKTASLKGMQTMSRTLAQHLKSSDPQDVFQALAVFKELFMCDSGATSLAATRPIVIVQMTREMQEAALEDDAALLVKLLKQMLSGRDKDFLRRDISYRKSDPEAEFSRFAGLELWSVAVIALLSLSRRMAKVILRLGSEQRIFARLAACLHCTTLFPVTLS